MTTQPNYPSYSNMDETTLSTANNAKNLNTDLDKAYKTTIKKHNDLEIYTIDTLNSIKDYRHFLNYPISKEEIPKYIELIYRNNYYIDKYNHQRKLLYVIDVYCIVIILLTLIKNNFSYFDEVAYSSIVGILLAVMVVYIIYQLWDMFLRSERIYDEYDFNKVGIPQKTSEEYDLNVDNKEPTDEC
jgi:hypothetical protein